MATHAAFVRAINLGRNRRVTSAELRAPFDELGFRNVQTFRTSGNVVFDAEPESEADMTARIEARLTETFGYEAAIFLRTADDVRGIAGQRPFADKLVAASQGKIQVMLLTGKPPARARKRVLALETDRDKLRFGERELYWLPSDGTLDSALDRQAVVDLIGPITMRTMGTIEQLAAKYF